MPHATSLGVGQSVVRTNSGDRSGDLLTWHHLTWIQWDETKVVATTLEPDEDLGWPLTAEDRAVLEANGHPHGVLHALVRHWEAREVEPTYSASALWHLHYAAMTLPAAEFAILAERLEGEAGSQLLQSTFAAHGHDDVKDAPPTPTAEDDAEPEPAPEPAPEPRVAGRDETGDQPVPGTGTQEPPPTRTADNPEVETGTNSES